MLVKVYQPNKMQIEKYKIYFIVIQSVCAILSILFINTKWNLFSDEKAYIIIGSLICIIFIKNLKFFNVKDLYTIYLYKDKVQIEYLSEWVVLGRRQKTLYFSNMQEVSFRTFPIAAGLFSHNSTQIIFKMLGLEEDFTLKSMGDSQFEKIAYEIQEELKNFRKE